MQNNRRLYEEQEFHRVMLDRIQALENEKRILREQQGKLWEETGLGPWNAVEYVSQIPCQCMTQIGSHQWKAPYDIVEDNFADYWSEVAQKHETVCADRRDEFRSIFRSTLCSAADVSRSVSPVVSLVFDGIGILTAGNLIEGIESVIRIIGTACSMDSKHCIH